jgi:hypothetical protein
VVVCSANDYFTDDKGVYRFDIEKIHEAHHKCLRLFLSEVVVTRTAARLIVDNTNVHPIAIAPYIAIAEAYGVEYEIVRMMPAGLTVGDMAARCIHNVPVDKIESMQYVMRNNPLPNYWKRELIIR